MTYREIQVAFPGGTRGVGIDLGSIALLHAVFGDLDRIGDDLAGVFFVSLVDLSRDGGGGPDGWRF